MKETRLLCAALGLAACLAAGCEEGFQTGGSGLSPAPAQPAASDAELAQLKQDNTALRAKVSELQASLTSAQAEARRADERCGQLRNQLAKATQVPAATLKKLNGEIARLSAENTRLKARSTQLQGDLGKAAATNRQLLGRAQQAEADAAEAKRQRLAEEAERKKTGDDVARMAKMVEALRQEVIKRNNQITALELRLTGKATAKAEPPPVWPSGTPAVPPAVPPKYVEVGAKLLQVRGDQARVNAGTAMGVYRGMKMAVYRGTKFVAFFLVAEVDLKSAGGFLLARKADPKVGDKVVSLPPASPPKKGG
jgi:hypothetical protein